MSDLGRVSNSAAPPLQSHTWERFSLPSRIKRGSSSYLSHLLQNDRPQEALDLVEMLLRFGQDRGERLLRLYGLGTALAQELGQTDKALGLLRQAVQIAEHQGDRSPLRFLLKEQLAELPDSLAGLQAEANAAEQSHDHERALCLRASILRGLDLFCVEDLDNLPNLAEEIRRSQLALNKSQLAPKEKCRFLLDAAELMRRLGDWSALAELIPPLAEMLKQPKNTIDLAPRQLFECLCATADIAAALNDPREALEYLQAAKNAASKAAQLTANEGGRLQLALADTYLALEDAVAAKFELAQGLKLLTGNPQRDPDLLAELLQASLLVAWQLGDYQDVKQLESAFKAAITDNPAMDPIIAADLAWELGAELQQLERHTEAAVYYQLSADASRSAGKAYLGNAFGAKVQVIICQLQSGEPQQAAFNAAYLARSVQESSEPSALRSARTLIALGTELLHRNLLTEGQFCLDAAYTASQRHYRSDPLGHAENLVQLAQIWDQTADRRTEDVIYEALATIHDLPDTDSTAIKLKALFLLSSRYLNQGKLEHCNEVLSDSFKFCNDFGWGIEQPVVLGLALNQIKYFNAVNQNEEGLLLVNELIDSVAALPPPTEPLPLPLIELQLQNAKGALLHALGHCKAGAEVLQLAAAEARCLGLDSDPVYARIQLNIGLNLKELGLDTTAADSAELLQGAMEALRQAADFFHQSTSRYRQELGLIYETCADISVYQGNYALAHKYSQAAAMLEQRR